VASGMCCYESWNMYEEYCRHYRSIRLHHRGWKMSLVFKRLWVL
jgi:hypothetical protein